MPNFGLNLTSFRKNSADKALRAPASKSAVVAADFAAERQTTHYPRHAKFVSNLTLFIKDGEILAFGRSEQLINAENIDKIYGINYERYEDRL